MVKTIIYVAITVVLSALAAVQFAGALEAASATRAHRDENVKRRSLELGIIGRAMFTVIFAAVMLVLAWMSNIMLLSTIVGLVLAFGLVVANVYLKGNGIHTLPSLFLLWIGNLISSLKDTNLGTHSSGWGTVYIILQVVALVLIVGLTALGNYTAYRRKMRKQDEDYEELEEDVDISEEEESESEDEPEDEYEDEEEDGGSEWDEEDPFHEKFWTKVIFIVLFVAIVAVAIVVGWHLAIPQ